MIQLNFLNAVAEDYGNGLIVNGKDLTSIISATLGTIKKIPDKYEYLGEKNKGKPFESRLCNVSVTKLYEAYLVLELLRKGKLKLYLGDADWNVEKLCEDLGCRFGYNSRGYTAMVYI